MNKSICLESGYPCDYSCSSDFTSPGSWRTPAWNYWSNLGSVHQVLIKAGWTEAVWNMKFVWHFHTKPELGIEPQTWDLLILNPTPYPFGHTLPQYNTAFLFFSVPVILWIFSIRENCYDWAVCKLTNKNSVNTALQRSMSCGDCSVGCSSSRLR